MQILQNRQVSILLICNALTYVYVLYTALDLNTPTKGNKSKRKKRYTCYVYEISVRHCDVRGLTAAGYVTADVMLLM